jgi:hypothetical protein
MSGWTGKPVASMTFTLVIASTDRPDLDCAEATKTERRIKTMMMKIFFT